MTVGRRSSREEHSISGAMNLGDLRWLVAQCDGLADTSSVTTTAYKSHNAREWDEASIKVSGSVPSA
jgi:hypothetical protein